MMTMIAGYLIGVGLTYFVLRMKDGWRSGPARPMSFGIALVWPFALVMWVLGKVRGS